MLKKYWFLVFGVYAVVGCVSADFHTARAGGSPPATSSPPPINLRSPSAHGDDGTQHSGAAGGDAHRYSPDDILAALKRTNPQPASRGADAPATLLSLDGLSEALPFANSFSHFFGPFDSTALRETMTGPLRSLTRFVSAPFTLIMNAGVADGTEVPALGDVLNDLSVASLTAETLYQGLAVFQTMLELPFAFLAHTVSGQPTETLVGLGMTNPDHANLKSQGVLGLPGLVDLARRQLGAAPDGAEGSAAATRNPAAPSLFGLSLPTANSVAEHKGRADQLAGNLDTLTMLMSGGLVNPLMFGLNGIADAMKHLIQAPTDALSWLGLAIYLQITEDTLRRMQTTWSLTPEQSYAISNATEGSHRLLTLIGDQLATIKAPFLSVMSEELQHLGDVLRTLNGTQLTPVLNLHGLDVSNILGLRRRLTAPTAGVDGSTTADDVQAIQFLLAPADFLMNAFGFPLQVVDALGRQAPFNISGLPLFNATDISPISMFGSLAEYVTRMMDIRRILAIVLDALPTNNATAPDGSGIDIDALLFPKTLLLSNAITLTTDLISRLSQTPLALFSVFSDQVNALAQLPMALLNALDPFAPTLPSNLPFNFLFPVHPAAREKRRRLDDTVAKPGTTPETTHQRLQPAIARSGDTAYKAQLLADQRVLKSAVSQMMRSRQTECDPHVAGKQETLKAQALGGNLKRMLSDAGVSNAKATDVLTGKTDHKKGVATHHRASTTTTEHNRPYVSPENAVELCEIKKGAVESVHTFSQKLADLAGNLGKLAHATTVAEAQDTQTLIQTQLSGLDVPPPPASL